MSKPKRRSYSPEFKEESVQLVLTGSESVAEVARDLGVNTQTLRNWVNKHQERQPGEELPLTVSERARLRELEREVVELREKSRFLGKAAAFFAQTSRLAANMSSSTGEKTNFRVWMMCVWLGVSRSGFSHWRSRSASRPR